MPDAPKSHRSRTRPPPRDDRPSAAARGYGRRWQRFRLHFLRQHPLCVMCEQEGRVTAAEHVDHVKAVTGPDDPLFWQEGNHQSLCHHHHSQKTAKEDGGWGRAKKEGKIQEEGEPECESE